jgi:hypothetical protein
MRSVFLCRALSLTVVSALAGCGDATDSAGLFSTSPGVWRSAGLAAQGDPVDPSTLTPPLDPEIFTCVRQGAGIVCDGRQPDAYQDLSPGPDFACGDRMILVSGFQLRTSRARNDAQGNRLEFRTHGTFDEVWRLEGSSGPELRVHGRWNERGVYGTPGDRSTRITTITGNEVSAVQPGRGVVFQNTGITRLDPDGEVLSQGGLHDFYTDFQAAIAAACQVLE